MNENYCPHCGRPSNDPTSHTQSDGWEYYPVNRFASGTAVLPANVARWEKVKPARKPTLGGDVGTPAAQALLTAVAAAVVAAVVTIAAGLPWWMPALVGVISFSLAWWLLLRYYLSLLQEREIITTTPPPVPVSKATPPPQTIKVEVKQDNQWRFSELPIDKAKLSAVGKALLLDNVTLSRSALCEAISISQVEYNNLTAAMEKAGLLAKIGKSFELTAAGRSVLNKAMEV